jgi:hypothetical protein
MDIPEIQPVELPATAVNVTLETEERRKRAELLSVLVSTLTGAFLMIQVFDRNFFGAIIVAIVFCIILAATWKEPKKSN